jgi:hypothetical protein
MKALLAIALILLGTSTAAFADSDFLAQATIQIDNPHSSEVLNRLVANPKAVFEHYQPALDSGSTIVRPLQVTGSATHPIMQVSIRKCVLFVCQTADLDADVTLREGKQAGCDRAFQLVANLSRSSDLVRNTYDRLDAALCYKANANGTGSLNCSASGNHASTYSQGFAQEQIFQMLQLQVQPIVSAVQSVLK